MEKEKKISLQIYGQRGKTIEAKLPADTGIYETEDIRIEIKETAAEGCRYGEIRLEMDNASCRRNDNLRMETPIRLYFPVAKRPEKITAMYMVNEWWTRPAFITGFDEMPDKTQVAFFQYGNRFACFVPMVGQKFKTYLTKGTKTEICMEMFCGLGGLREVNEPLYVMAEASVLEEAVHKVFLWLAKNRKRFVK